MRGMNRCQSTQFRVGPVAAAVRAAAPDAAATAAPDTAATATMAPPDRLPSATGSPANLVPHQRGLSLPGPIIRRASVPAVGVLGVAWFRIASAAVVFAPITRPWRLFARMTDTSAACSLAWARAWH